MKRLVLAAGLTALGVGGCNLVLDPDSYQLHGRPDGAVEQVDAGLIDAALPPDASAQLDAGPQPDADVDGGASDCVLDGSLFVGS
jgi:hypothetical protein